MDMLESDILELVLPLNSQPLIGVVHTALTSDPSDLRVSTTSYPDPLVRTISDCDLPEVSTSDPDSLAGTVSPLDPTEDDRPLIDHVIKWVRYVDDIFVVWCGFTTQLKNLLSILNHYHPKLKFKHELVTNLFISWTSQRQTGSPFLYLS